MQIHRHTRAVWRLAAAAVLLSGVLAGCGGGDSGDDDEQTTSGLVPDPPAPGATLFADATVLRPMVGGASWSYRGVDPDGAAYTNVVKQVNAAQGVIESFTNTFGQGEGSHHLAVVGGNVVEPDPTDVDGDGINDISNAIELRSPVRVDDQFVAFDRHLPGFVPDLDGDGKGEALDLAIYSRVVGLENVVLESGTVSATRVDHIVAARVVGSKNGQALPTVKSTQMIWYAPSLGIVRQRMDAPADDGLTRLIADEKLVDWDGLPGH